jgi:hypothetical protein
MNGPFRAGHKKPHATVYRQAEGDPPEGTLVAVAMPSTGCNCCGDPVTGEHIARALNMLHAIEHDRLTELARHVAHLLGDLPREERRRRIASAYNKINEGRTSGGVALTEEMLDQLADEAEQDYGLDQIKERTQGAP